MIRIGTAGWSHSDWDGIVYPASRGLDFHPLAIIARLFDLAEITSTHAQSPKAKWGREWCDLLDRLAAERFRFSVTLWRGITESVELPKPEEVQKLRQLCEVLHSRGRLAAVLARFPASFKDSVSGRARIERIAENWGDYPIALEMPNATWASDDAIGWLGERDLALVDLDHPATDDEAKTPPLITTKSLAYVRLLGRTETAEEADSAGLADYQYTPQQLAPWAHRIGQISAKAKQVLVVTANGARAQGVANALEIQAATSDRVVRVPQRIIEQFTTLREVPGLRLGDDSDFDLPPVEKGKDTGQLDLF